MPESGFNQRVGLRLARRFDCEAALSYAVTVRTQPTGLACAVSALHIGVADVVLRGLSATGSDAVLACRTAVLCEQFLHLRAIHNLLLLQRSGQCVER